MSLVNLPDRKKKTPSAKTFGVLLFGFHSLFVSFASTAECVPEGTGELAKVDRVYDGDTIKLTDGRHVRILGVNAPEVDHSKEKTGQALGDESRAATESFFKKDKTVRLFYDVQRVDRYERTLAHVYDSKGNSLSGYLLRNGLGFHVAVPPNLSLNECLHNEEALARRKQLGVWQDIHWRATPAAELTLLDTGFKRVTGKVVSVRQAQSIWLELDGPLVIKISPSDKKNFSVKQWQLWKGKEVEVRGWITDRSNNAEAKEGADDQGDVPAKKGKSRKISPAKSFKSLVVQPRIPGALELLN